MVMVPKPGKDHSAGKGSRHARRGATVHGHSLEGLDAINDFLKKEKAYKGSNTNKVGELCKIAELAGLIESKRVRWVASVYGRHLPELLEVAEKIIREVEARRGGRVDRRQQEQRGGRGSQQDPKNVPADASTEVADASETQEIDVGKGTPGDRRE